MKNKKYKEYKLFEYRVRYNAGQDHIAQDSYHYFMAKSASEALRAHKSMLLRRRLCAQDISIEKFNPYSQKWEDRLFINDKSFKKE